MNKFKNIQKLSFPSQVKGVGLIEVLVSILVLGVGALGVASMQLTGLKYNSGSQGRTQAIFLATDMMDRIRANRDLALEENDYLIADLSVSADIGVPGVDCYTASCSPQQLADFDQYYFLRQVEDLVPFGEGQVTITNDTNGDRVYNITIQWRDVVGRQDREGLTITDDIDLSTFTFSSAL